MSTIAFNEMRFSISIILLLTVFRSGKNVKILGVFTFPSYSHQITFQAVYKELVIRGHSVTVITPNPMNDKTLGNLREINIHQVYDLLSGMEIGRVVTKDKNLFYYISLYYTLIGEANELAFGDQKVQNLLESDETFDILIVQVAHPLTLSIAARYRVPVIGECFDCYYYRHFYTQSISKIDILGGIFEYFLLVRVFFVIFFKLFSVA